MDFIRRYGDAQRVEFGGLRAPVYNLDMHIYMYVYMYIHKNICSQAYLNTV